MYNKAINEAQGDRYRVSTARSQKILGLERTIVGGGIRWSCRGPLRVQLIRSRGPRQLGRHLSAKMIPVSCKSKQSRLTLDCISSASFLASLYPFDPSCLLTITVASLSLFLILTTKTFVNLS